MTTQLALVKPEDIPDIWINVKPLINKALVHTEGNMSSYDALRLLLNERQQLWIGFEESSIACAGITEVIPYPRHKILRVITFSTKSGYDLDFWENHLGVVEKFGVDCGCTRLEAWTRKGLAEKLKWEHEYAVISKPIKPRQQRKRRRRPKKHE